MDGTALWLVTLGNTTINTTEAKDMPLKLTGN